MLSGSQKQIIDCSLFLVWICDLSRLHQYGLSENLQHEAMDYMEVFTMSVIDTSLAAQNAAIASESLGLYINYIGAIRNNPLEVASILNLPDHAFALYGMCIGYALDKSEIKPRLPQFGVLHHEIYNKENCFKAVKEYLDIIDVFYKEQKHTIRGKNWGEHSLNRLKYKESLNGREKMIENLKKLGFSLN